MCAIRRRQSGDTIVEVLIALAIVSFVLSGAYATTNRSVLTTQDTQEHSRALQLAQGQIELLRSYVQTFYNSHGGNYPGLASQCLDSTAIPQPSGQPNPSADCFQDISAANYKLDIEGAASTAPAIPSAYVISITWNSLLGGSQDNIILYYRP